MQYLFVLLKVKQKDTLEIMTAQKTHIHCTCKTFSNLNTILVSGIQREIHKN
jgi:hypothetical protein